MKMGMVLMESPMLNLEVVSADWFCVTIVILLETLVWSIKVWLFSIAG